MKECSQNEETEEYKKWNKENEKLLAKGHNLLEEFYKERKVEPDVKLQIEEGVGNFRIHNGGEDYQPVIEEEREFTEEEKKIRAEKVGKYRAEMQEFTKFLRNRYFEEVPKSKQPEIIPKPEDLIKPKATPEELEKAGVKPSFKEKLVDFPEGYSMSLKQLENNPEKIVKISRKENIYRFSPKNNPVESPESLEIIKKSKEHYEELINKYGIAVTPFEYAIDMDEEEKEPVLYSVSDKIYGDNLLTKVKECKFDENIKEVEDLLIALTNYFEDKFYNDNYYLEDVGNLSNYMYGHRKGENKDRIYLVDIEPVLSDLNSLEKRKHFYSRMKESFYPHIEYAEKEMGVNLTDVRKEYSDFIEGVKTTSEENNSKTESQEIQGERLIEYSQKVGSFYASFIENLTKMGEAKNEILNELPDEIRNKFKGFIESIDKNSQLQHVRFSLKEGGAKDLLSKLVERRGLDKELIDDKSKYELEEISPGIFVVFMDKDLYLKLHGENVAVATLEKDGVSFISMPKEYRKEKFRNNLYKENLLHESHHIVWSFLLKDEKISIKEADEDKKIAYRFFQNEVTARLCSGGGMMGYSHLLLMDKESLKEFICHFF